LQNFSLALVGGSYSAVGAEPTLTFLNLLPCEERELDVASLLPGGSVME
jgi:hypothetical protein